MAHRTLHRAFAGGEISPEMLGRIEDAHYQAGLATCLNFIVRPQGPIARRPGFAFVAETKHSTLNSRLITFRYSGDETVVIELGQNDGASAGPTQGYARFYVNGGQVVFATDPPVFMPIVSSVDTGADSLTFTTDHGLDTGHAVQFTNSGGGLPAGISAAVTYYVYVTDSDTLELATTEALALAGTPDVDITTAGTGTHRMHPERAQGDTVRHSGTNYYAFDDYDGTDTSPPVLVFYALTGDIVEVPTYYTAADLFEITYAQSGDVMTLCHRNYQIAELVRRGATDWLYRVPVIGAGNVGIPGTLTGLATPGQTYSIRKVEAGGSNAAYVYLAAFGKHFFAVGDSVYLDGAIGGSNEIVAGFYTIGVAEPANERVTLMYLAGGAPATATSLDPQTGSRTLRYASPSSETTNYYKATAIAEDGSESLGSAQLSITNNLFVSGAKNRIGVPEVEGAVRYRIYKAPAQTGGAVFGFIGETEDVVAGYAYFYDDNIDPDLGILAPSLDDSLNDDYPGAVGYLEQRRAFGGTDDEPQAIWMTQTGTESDLTYHLPPQDTDRVFFRIAAREAADIRHLVPMDHLMVLTSTVEFRVSPVNNDVIAPDSVSVRAQTYIGSNFVRPIVANGTLIFCAARGGHVREFGYTRDGAASGDLSTRAAHLFDNLNIVDSAHAKAPYQILWFVSSDGKLLGVTYQPEERLAAWHKHTTDGTFESCAIASEGDEDHLYVVVNRTIDSATVRYVERMGAMASAAIEDSFFVDSGLTYDGATTTTITGLDHLEGETVKVLADGVEVADEVVSSGSITIASASVVQVGLAYNSDAETLPATYAVDGAGQGRTKNVNEVRVRVYQSGPFTVGPTSSLLRPHLPAVATLQTREVQVVITPTWGDGGKVFIRGTAPLPLTVVAMVTQVVSGG